MGANLQLMGGQVLLEKYDSDGITLGAMYKPGTTDVFSFGSEVEKVEHFDTEEEDVVQDGEDYGKRTIPINFETKDINEEFDKMAFLSTLTPFTQTAQTDTAVVIASATLDTIADLGYMDVTDIVVTDSTDATTYVLGTDYTYDRKWGTMVLLSTGDISELDEIHVTLSANEITTGKDHESFTTDKQEFRLTYQGRSSKGRNEKHTWEKVSIVLNGDRVLKSGDNEYTGYSFTAAALKHNGKTHSMKTY